MSPTPFQYNHTKRSSSIDANTSDITSVTTNGYHDDMCLSLLKINKESHTIKKSSCTLSTTAATTNSSASSAICIGSPTSPLQHPPQQRRPVIIYTNSPKVIHTNPKDFMSLVQKLTGLSGSDNVDQIHDAGTNRDYINHNYFHHDDEIKIKINCHDTDSSLEENCSSSTCTTDHSTNVCQLNSCIEGQVAPQRIFDQLPPAAVAPASQFVRNWPLSLASGPTDLFYCKDQYILDCTDLKILY